jgi:hypothetical protein
MEEEAYVTVKQARCVHGKERWYVQRRFDILNGFEIVLTRCINCHKTMEIEVKKLN